MVKAKEFLKFLCEDLNYRFFSGVPCIGFKPIYDSMSSKFMHYVPAVNEKTALGISVGAVAAGVKSGVFVDSRFINYGIDWVDFCKKYKCHLIVITNNVVGSVMKSIEFDGDYDTLKLFLEKAHQNKRIASVVLKEVV